MDLYDVFVTLAFALLMLLGIAWRVRVWRNATDREVLSREDEAALEAADRLQESDPATAQRILNEHFEKKGEREDAERDALRSQAPTSRAAAEELRKRLLEDLEVWQNLLKHARKKARKDPMARQAVANLEQWENETRAELAAMDHLIGIANT